MRLSCWDWVNQNTGIIKQQPDALCLSTIESVYTVINLLRDAGLEQCDTKDFLLPFEKMIDFQVACILNPDNKHYRSDIPRAITPKDRYKKKPVVRVIFEWEKKPLTKGCLRRCCLWCCWPTALESLLRWWSWCCWPRTLAPAYWKGCLAASNEVSYF